jgi:type IV pilus assembly protein PilA
MLARIRKAMEEKEEGFTLIELLVVIIIIGILAAIAIPVFLNQRKKGYDAAIKSDLRNAATAEETYLTDNSVYTDVQANLTANGWKQSKASNYDATAGQGFVKTGFYAADGTTYTSGAATATAVGGYCLELKSASGTTWAYDSTKGGLQGANSVCA